MNIGLQLYSVKTFMKADEKDRSAPGICRGVQGMV